MTRTRPDTGARPGPATRPEAAPDPGAAWEERNAEFLAASLDWLRLLLRAHASAGAGAGTGAEAAPADRPAPPPPRWRRRAPGPPAPPAPAPHPGPAPAELAAAAARVAAAEDVEPPPALVTLARRLGLSRFERDVLLMCLAEELSPAVGALFAAAHGSAAMAHPTFALALAVLPDPTWEAASPHGTLRARRLVEVSHTAGSALVTSPVRADERVVDHVKGLGHLDERLAVLVTPLPYEGIGTPLPPSQRAAADRCAAAWDQASATPPVLHLTGPQPGSKHLVAAHTAREFGLTPYRLPAALLPAHPADLDHLARLWGREAALLPVALYLDADEEAAPEAAALVGRFLSRVGAPVFLASRDPHPAPEGRRAVVVEVAPPTTRERAAAWREALGPAAGPGRAGLLAAQFAMDVPAIHEAARAGGPDRIREACVARGRTRLDGLAQRLCPEVGWEDLVLPEEATGLLRQIAGQVTRQETVHDRWGFADRLTRGLGVTALFAGPSGTGKTMAAEVLARELGLDLYRTDLSGVMSKYIGETEKNLRRLFDAAEAGGAVLLLDEADALLGRRGEIRDAHDRYANVQVDYLLQRMESYRGLAIMATNMRAALDAALVRRLRFVVEFPFPDAARRAEIWRRAFPEHAPGRDALDYDRLARLDVSGAMTRTIALNAAFLAAADGGVITMPLVLRAAREEFRKLQHPVRERDFTWTRPRPDGTREEALS